MNEFIEMGFMPNGFLDQELEVVPQVSGQDIDAIEEIDRMLTSKYAMPEAELILWLGRLLILPDVSAERMVDIVLRSLDLELQRLPSDRSEYFMSQLIDALYVVDGTASCAVLKAIAVCHSSKQVAALARSAEKFFQYSITRTWQETPVDQISDLGSRAHRLENIPSHLSETETIQWIFCQMKGLRLETPDARWCPLSGLLSAHVNSRVRFATAVCICAQCSDDATDEFLVPAVVLLADYAVNSSDIAEVADALAVLNSMQKRSLRLAAIVAQAQHTASQKFILENV